MSTVRLVGVPSSSMDSEPRRESGEVVRCCPPRHQASPLSPYSLE